MPDKATKSKSPENGTSKKPKPTLHIRKIPPEVIALVNGVAGYAEIDRDDLVTMILRKTLKRFRSNQTETKDWVDSYMKSND